MKDYPVTSAVRFLRKNNVAFVPHLYDYIDHGGTAQAAQCIGTPEHTVIKTLALEDDGGAPLLVLMHGDREVSTKTLGRILGSKRVTFCDPKSARKFTGYIPGGISPFGTVRPMRVYAESGIFELEKIFINGGKRGFMVEIDPKEVLRTLDAVPLNVAV